MRQWLEDDPEGRLAREYNAFVDKENKRRGGDRPLVKASAITNQLALQWREVLKVARGEATLAEIEQHEVARLLDGTEGDLVGSRQLGAILGLGLTHAYRLAGGTRTLPTVVAVIGGRKAYFTQDVIACRDGRDVPVREEGCLQDKLLETRDVAAALNITPDTARTYMNEGHWHRIPHPSGTIGHARYWWKDDFASWRKAQKSK